MELGNGLPIFCLRSGLDMGKPGRKEEGNGGM